MKSIREFDNYKSHKARLSLVTAYDSYTAQVVEDSDIDAILVGDSLYMVMHGGDSTLGASVDLMETHIRAVRKGAPTKLIIGDMPFLSTRLGLSDTVQNAGRLMRAGANAVKIEGLTGHEEIIPHLVHSGIPVMGHLGLQPQSVHLYGGYHVQGMESEAFDHIVSESKKLEQLGCFSIVLECVPEALAKKVQESVAIPVIGIGAGRFTAGQILVLQDLWGFGKTKKPRFVRRFGKGSFDLAQALSHYVQAVVEGSFPKATESYHPLDAQDEVKVFHEPRQWQDYCNALRSQGSIGFVPTMGALHEGHTSLILESNKTNDFTLVSIFVNPTQFNDPKDLAAYPRVVAADLDLLKKNGVTAVFVPSSESMYPDQYRYKMTETDFSKTLEGEHRPGHFDGMLSVVLKLLLVTKADRAYFGEKDYQQLRLVEGMVKTYFIETDIIPCPIIREESGLAMSSRNERLSKAGRLKAADIYKIISTAKSPDDASTQLESGGFEVEYVFDMPLGDGGVRRLVAVKFEGIRLIDNILIGGKQ